MTDTYELPEPAVMCDCGGNYFTADQVRLAIQRERERAAKVAEVLNRPDTLRLRMGEMTAQEMRSVQAALRMVAAAIRQG